LGCEGQEVNIVIVDDVEITRLNRQYFHRHRPTNVISFPLAAGNPQILGDVVISAETAKRQSEAAGGETEEEILFLMIHGILHLLSYDHVGSRDGQRKMEEKERELFSLFLSPSRRG